MESKYLFGPCVAIFDRYLFQLHVLLKPGFTTSLVDKVTT